MPMPVRSLPVLQNWDCHSCSDCCRTYAVAVTADERERIEKQNWAIDPDLKGVTIFETGKDGVTLAHRPDGACVFLGPDNRCRIHAKFGSAAKPLACRVYPLVMIPTGDYWRVGLRYSCPSVAKNEGRAMTAHAKDAAAYAAELEPRDITRDLPPPPLQGGQTVAWPDLSRFVTAFAGVLSKADRPMEWKLRHLLLLTSQLRILTYEKVVGNRLTELVNVLAEGVEEDVPPAEQVPPPGWVGRMLFRQLASVHARVDRGPDRGTMPDGGWIRRMRAGYRFAVGTGRVPQVNSLLAVGVRFEVGEQFAGPLPAESEQLFLRYFRTKLDSMQFAGPINFHLPFWAGLDSLILVFPMTLWLSRLITTADRPRPVAIREALRLIDNSYGFNPLLRPKLPSALRSLHLKEELPRLVAWYSR
ncbi:YkgJ family cysteine cluster protein [Limnoglobus roseus]|uniref:YkgJ family cysteine cluster protein n=1 Tax=Limnoglobus roseus TaxID=2598579 RepID=A0A5C1AM06_9BACT|nr:YkgJ family cysteine cluster protein [Limnoglobus roseus]QEL20251.1 YkgJ family cysteine cluster protein [Limnoglobus roseus]